MLVAFVLAFLLLGIDGLRQDVLYAQNDVGVPGDGVYVDPGSLLGIGQVLGGRLLTELIEFPTDPMTDPVEIPVTTLTGDLEGRHVKLRGVTAVFPSITLASWASIFTGELPGKTGELGNEFFARDQLNQPGVPNERGVTNPAGMVSYSSGSFPGFDALKTTLVLSLGWVDVAIPVSAIQWSDFVPPMENVEVGADKTKGAQNRLLQTELIHAQLRGPTGTDGRAGRSVVQSSHYARGADLWLTHFSRDTDDTLGRLISLAWTNRGAIGAGGTSAAWMDGMSSYSSRKWLDAHKEAILDGKESFPGLWVFYVAGLDHDAHDSGMGGGYRQFFIDKTDTFAIAKFVDKLKEVGQFYNKVFLITSDHGHTEMAGNLTLEEKDDAGNVIKTWTGDTSCAYKSTGFGSKKTQYPEQANNNLHVWELGEVFKQIAKRTGGSVERKVLGPAALAEVSEAIVTGKDPDVADVVAALNGPMAHIYVKNSTTKKWADLPDPEVDAGPVAEALRVALMGQESQMTTLYPAGTVPWMARRLGRIVGSVEAVLIRVGGSYKVFEGLDAAGKLITPLGLGSLDSARHVRAEERINGMNHDQRSGDIILLFKSDVNNIAERYTSGVSCKSWHGSLNRTDSYVPFILSYPGGNAAELNDPIEAVCPKKECAGNWKATDLIKKIIETQYSGK